MKRPIVFLAIFSFTIITICCKEENKILLFNGEDLSNWTIFIPDSGTVPGDVFWVEGGVMKVAGEPHGYIRTKEKYSNYKLHLEWRWVSEPANSGVMLHINGEDKLWPKNIEAQLMHQNAGDLAAIQTGTGITAKGKKYVVDSETIWYAIAPKMHESNEKEPGEWNTYDILCRDGEIELTVNGLLQNKGTEATLTGGFIGIQSEGGPMEFRNIWLETLD